MNIVHLTCQVGTCNKRHVYRLAEVNVSLYTHGICTVAFTCRTCKVYCEFEIPDDVALHLDKKGCPTTIVRVPDEVSERPAPDVPAITEVDAAVFEAASMRRFEEARQRELADMLGDNVRLEES